MRCLCQEVPSQAPYQELQRAISAQVGKICPRLPPRQWGTLTNYLMQVWGEGEYLAPVAKAESQYYTQSETSSRLMRYLLS